MATAMIRPAEAFWTKSHGKDWVARYAASTIGPKRGIIGAALRSVAPFDTAIDVGCNCGVLVPWILSASPTARVTGLDVSREALQEADRIWPQFMWVIGSAVDWLPGQVGQQAWDVVITSSCLAHVAPHDVKHALAAIAKVATKAIVLQEVTTADQWPEGSSGDAVGVPEWRHDYVRRLAAFGWRCVARWPQDEPNRPAAVMVFSK